jgi:cell shape-determining protein MreC
MTMFDANPWRTLLARPRATLAATLVVALVLALLPRRAVEPLARFYNCALEPGRMAAGYVCDSCAIVVALARHSAATADDVAVLTAEARQLRARNRELETALRLANRRATDVDPRTDLRKLPPLILTHAVRARVLGRRACAALGTAHIAALGRDAGMQPDSLVLVDSTVAVDQGQQADVATGDIALEGRRVFGKVIEVGPHTSIVRRASEPGYRDVVQLARLVDGKLEFGPKGILEGTGERYCRMRLVSANEAIEVGNRVFTAGHEGLAPQPLWYGVIARAERHDGAPHWDICVELDAGADDPSHLIVLRAQLNPARLADANRDKR